MKQSVSLISTYSTIDIQVFAEQVQNFVGADEISPAIELGSFSYEAWSEISADCGDSRVWGGMHFEVSRTRQRLWS